MKSHIVYAVLALAMFRATGVEAAHHCPPTPESFAELRARVLKPQADHIVVVAHRGCFAAASENTPEAIEACWQQGVEVVENDVRRTRDGHLVVFHDPEISRMTDRWGYVAEMTLAELREARLKERDGSHEAYRSNFLTDQPLATLEEYLSAIRHRVMVNFEIKHANRAEFEEIFEQSITMAQELGVLDHLIFKIPDTRHHGRSSVQHLLEEIDVPEGVMIMPIIWGSETPLSERMPFFAPFRPVGFEIPFEDIRYIAPVGTLPELADTPVMVVTVQPYWSGGFDDRRAMLDPDAVWGRLIAEGADHIMTDRPEALLRYLASRNLRQQRNCE